MPRLPSDRFVMQKIGYEVILFEIGTEFEIVRFNPVIATSAAAAQKVINESALLDDQDKTFAHFWSGYFYHAALMGT